MHLRSYFRLTALLPLILLLSLRASSTSASPVDAKLWQFSKRTLTEYHHALEEVFEKFAGVRGGSGEVVDARVKTMGFRSNWQNRVDEVLTEYFNKYETASKSLRTAVTNFNKYETEANKEELVETWRVLYKIYKDEHARTAKLYRIFKESDVPDLNDEKGFLQKALAKHEALKSRLFERLNGDFDLYYRAITNWNTQHPDKPVFLPRFAGLNYDTSQNTFYRFRSSAGSSSSGPR